MVDIISPPDSPIIVAFGVTTNRCYEIRTAATPNGLKFWSNIVRF